MGLSSRIVGITDYCPAPIDQFSPAKRIGGTKSPDLDAIFALTPDFVIANQEENNREKVESLIEEGLDVWLTFPKTVAEVIGELQILARVFEVEREWVPKIETLEKTYEWCHLSYENRMKIAPDLGTSVRSGRRMMRNG
jgi:ABC-type enterochelin transport system substrate-binding protein